MNPVQDIIDSAVAGAPKTPNQTPNTFQSMDVAGPVQPTGYRIDPPTSVPSDTLSSTTTVEDVFSRRNQLEAQVNQKAFKNQSLQDIVNNLNSFDPASLFQRPVTDAAQMRQDLLNQITETTTGRVNDPRSAFEDAGVRNADARLGAIQQEIADRTVQKRQDTRNYDTNAGFRGRARQFTQGERTKMIADANAELADLAIQELAASGSFDRAFAIAQAELDQEQQIFDDQIAQLQAQVDALNPMLEEEDRIFQSTLQFKLDQLKQQQADERTTREGVIATSMQAAAEGAPRDLVSQIAAATSEEEALILASEWLGRTDRLNAEAQRANIWSQIKERQTKNLPSAAEVEKKQNAIAKATQDTERQLGHVSEALSEVGRFTTGIGAVTKFIPGTPARDLSGTIDTIKANLGFDELDAMRQASPTGGALGQVSEREIAFLQSTIASLDQFQSQDELVENLNEIAQSYARWAQTVGLEVAQDPNTGEYVLVEIID